MKKLCFEWSPRNTNVAEYIRKNPAGLLIYAACDCGVSPRKRIPVLSEGKYQASIKPLSDVNMSSQKEATKSTGGDTSGEHYTLLAEVCFIFVHLFFLKPHFGRLENRLSPSDISIFLTVFLYSYQCLRHKFL